MNTENKREGGVKIQMVERKQMEARSKERSTILKHLTRQRVESTGSVDSLNKRKREEEDRLEAEKELLGNFEKVRRVARSPAKKKATINDTEEQVNGGRIEYTEGDKRRT